MVDISKAQSKKRERKKKGTEKGEGAKIFEGNKKDYTSKISTQMVLSLLFLLLIANKDLKF